MRKKSRGASAAITLVLVGCVFAGLAWKLNWVSLEWSSAERESPVAAADTESAAAAIEELPPQPTPDALVLTAQSEPPVQEGSNRAEAIQRESARQTLLDNRWSRPLLAAGAEPSHTPAGSVQPAEFEIPAEVQQTVEPVGNETPNDEDDPAEPAPAAPAETSPAPGPLAEIDRLIELGDYLAAHRQLSKIYWSEPDRRAEIKRRIDQTAQSIFFDPQPHFVEPYIVQPNDQLRSIARNYKVPWQYLAQLNRIDPRRIRPGQKLKVIRGPFAAVVDLQDFALTVHLQGYYVRRYPVGIGKDGSSPLGKFTVLNKVENPQYTDPEGRVISGDDPQNPLGERWIDLGDSYGIHGTIDPSSVGQAKSRGCIRMRNEDVEEVYALLIEGSQVVIRR